MPGGGRAPRWTSEHAESSLLKQLTFHYLEASEGPTVVALQIQVPTLYLHGRDDGCIVVELAEGIETFFDNQFTTAIVEDAGHFLHQERPNEINRLILEFLQA